MQSFLGKAVRRTPTPAGPSGDTSQGTSSQHEGNQAGATHLQRVWAAPPVAPSQQQVRQHTTGKCLCALPLMLGDGPLLSTDAVLTMKLQPSHPPYWDLCSGLQFLCHVRAVSVLLADALYCLSPWLLLIGVADAAAGAGAALLELQHRGCLRRRRRL